MNRRNFLVAGGLAAAGALMPARLMAAQSDILARVRAAFDRHGRSIDYRDRVGITDFNSHSSRPRFHLVDMDNGRIESFLVAHGRGSDPTQTGWVQGFSNRQGSNASSAGSYVTRDLYIGKHGRSRRLIGLDAENDAALSRNIVIHAASYVSAQRAAIGPIGRSEGCFAFADADIGTVLDRLGSGRLLLAYKG